MAQHSTECCQDAAVDCGALGGGAAATNTMMVTVVVVRSFQDTRLFDCAVTDCDGKACGKLGRRLGGRPLGTRACGVFTPLIEHAHARSRSRMHADTRACTGTITNTLGLVGREREAWGRLVRCD